jgi:hypothetical protein
MQYIFLDESGQFYKNTHESFFVIGSFITANPTQLAKRFRAWQQKKFPKKLRYQAEVKFSDRGINPELKLKTLQYIASLDVRVRFSYLRTENIPVEYRKGGRIMTGRLYTHVVSETLASYFPYNDSTFNIICDHHHIKGYRKSEYLFLLRSRLLLLVQKNAYLNIEMIDSTSNSNVQIADWIASSLAAYLNNKPVGEQYFTALKNNIIGEGMELFPNQWAL